MENSNKDKLIKLIQDKEVRGFIDNLVTGNRIINEQNFGKIKKHIGEDKELYSDFVKILFNVQPDILNYFHSIPEEMFSGINWLYFITIPKNIVSIEDGAFESCTSLRKVMFEAGSCLQEIGDCAFVNCEQLKSIRIPRGVVNIGDNAFEHCDSLEIISFPQLDCNLKTIGSQAFARNSELKKIIFPKGLKSIDVWAFLGCPNLKYVYMPESVNSINGNIFRECGIVTVETKNPYVIQYCEENNIQCIRII